MLRAMQARVDAGVPESFAWSEAIDEVLQGLIRRVAVPKRFTLPLKELLLLQPRFERRDGRRALALLSHPRFRAAYDFMLLRTDAGLVSGEIAQWWTEIQTLDHDGRVAMVAAVPRPARPAQEDGETLPEGEVDDRPRRRRRRRRPQGPAQ